MCGLTAARELQERGVQVTLLDKGRGVGGRMATRRVETNEQVAVFDHGAQFFTARSNEFRKAVAQWQETSLTEEWFRGQTKVLSNQQVQHQPDSHPRFRGTLGMTVIPKQLALHLDIHLKQRVTKIVRSDSLWRVCSENGDEFEAESLIITAPVPQSLALLDSGNFALQPDVRADLETVQYDPCIAAMIVVEGAQVPAPGALYFEGEPISWISDNYQKGISSVPGSLTIHAAAQFSRDHWETSEAEVIKVLCEAAQPFVGSQPHIVASSLHRWRYSKPSQPRNDGCVAVEPNLIFAGDAFAGAKVEGAFMSGLAAAKVLCG